MSRENGQSINFTRNSLEPIKEESLSSNTDVRTSTGKTSGRELLQPIVTPKASINRKSKSVCVTKEQELLDEKPRQTVKKSTSGRIISSIKSRESQSKTPETTSSISIAVSGTSVDGQTKHGIKVCPTTKTECPTMKAIDEKFRQSYQETYGDNASDYSDASEVASKKSYSSILDKPFIFRRAESLQKAIDLETSKFERYLLEGERQQHLGGEEERAASSYTPKTTDTESVEKCSNSGTSTTPPTSATTTRSVVKRRLTYLLGLESQTQEEEEGTTPPKINSDEQFIAEEGIGWADETEAVRQARRYLRVHRIFEFYQFLIAHLLSALPDNPINFLLSMLDKCIVYRAGIGNPPVLYERKHLEALFNLMDRMRTDYIDKEQYVTGMKTLGICSYNPNPPMTDDMIHKNFFIEEAYENLISMLNDIIRRRWVFGNTQPMPITTPPPTPQFTSHSRGSTPSTSKVRKN